MIRFSEPPFFKKGIEYMEEAVSKNKIICGDGQFTKLCNEWITTNTGTAKTMLTTSCTHALEMSALLLDIQDGDEIIMPSFTFVSTANAFVLRGAKIVFVDIRPDTMNIDEKLIDQAITSKTKAIVPVHYAGVGCEMDAILEIAGKNHLSVVEDAAQAVNATYKGKSLGSLGDFGCYSFHETKNYTMGEGGALLLKNTTYVERAEIMREKGTDRSKFFRGMIDKYTWVDRGSSYLPSEFNAAYLYAQLEVADEINENRIATWNLYHSKLYDLSLRGKIELPFVPDHCKHNAHMYYIKVSNLQERIELAKYLNRHGINAVFHYIPLHLSDAGKKYSRFSETDRYTTMESERLLRLPLFYNFPVSDVAYVCDKIYDFFA